MIHNDGYLTVAELAKILKISRVAVFKKIKNGQIKAKKVGKTYLILRESLKGILYSDMTDKLKNEIELGVKKVIKDYSETLKMLGKE
ncbi:MAG: helix-turn-helix domain-containing protein [Smithella sp.]|nr:helix-turn-helix domain-containing protein [Smithella sp.]